VAAKKIDKLTGKEEIFQTAKSTTQNTAIYHQSATNSPQFTIQKHTKIRTTPCKNHLDTPTNFFQ
jgi:hypothetical protein